MTTIQIPEPRLSKFLFSDTHFAWVWLPLRVWLGWTWLGAGWGKFNNSAWIGEKAGTAITGYFKGILADAASARPDVTSWYADIIQNFALPNATVFSYLITFGEIAVGLGLILGAFTGIAAFFGTFMSGPVAIQRIVV